MSLVKETAKAWGLGKKETQEIFDWVNANIEPHRRSKILIHLLRKHREEKAKK